MMFAYSKCPHCGDAGFKTIVQEPEGLDYKLIFVQCAACDAPIGVLDCLNVGAMLDDQNVILEEHGQQLSRIEASLQEIKISLKGLAQTFGTIMRSR